MSPRLSKELHDARHERETHVLATLLRLVATDCEITRVEAVSAHEGIFHICCPTPSGQVNCDRVRIRVEEQLS